MSYSEKLAERVRPALADLPREKKMFGGLAFMLDDKMCITIGENRILVRVDEAVLKSKKRLDAWTARAVAFNKHAQIKAPLFERDLWRAPRRRDSCCLKKTQPATLVMRGTLNRSAQFD